MPAAGPTASVGPASLADPQEIGDDSMQYDYDESDFRAADGPAGLPSAAGYIFDLILSLKRPAPVYDQYTRESCICR
jgi:hypothetical protein